MNKAPRQTHANSVKAARWYKQQNKGMVMRNATMVFVWRKTGSPRSRGICALLQAVSRVRECEANDDVWFGAGSGGPQDLEAGSVKLCEDHGNPGYQNGYVFFCLSKFGLTRLCQSC